MRNVLDHGAGKQLRTLRIQTSERFAPAPEPMDWLLDACPNLTELCLSLDGLAFERQLSALPTLPRLRTLRFDACRQPTMPGTLLKLLQLAPNLENLDINSRMVDVHDLQTLAALVENGPCLRQLERLKFRRCTGDPNLGDNQWNINFDQFVVVCSISCLKLYEVNIVDGPAHFGQWPSIIASEIMSA